MKGMAGTTGLEPATSAVTGQRSNQLNYVPTRQINFAKALRDKVLQPLSDTECPSPVALEMAAVPAMSATNANKSPIARETNILTQWFWGATGWSIQMRKNGRGQ
jgi:hypothetical protein